MFCIGFATAALLFDGKDEKGNQIVIKPKYQNYSRKAQKTLSQLWQDVKDCGENNPELKKNILGQIEAAEWFADLAQGGNVTVPIEDNGIKLESFKVYIGDRALDLDESYEWFQEAIEEKAAREKLDGNGLVGCGCGGKAHRIDVQGGDYNEDGFSIECEKCGIGGEISFKTQTKADEWWNTAMGGSHVKK